MPEIEIKPGTSELDTVENGFDSRFMVLAYDNDYTPFDAVMGVFIISCGYDEKTAHKFTMEIHQKGSSICFWNSEKRCEEVINDFKKINVRAELIKDKE